MTDWRAFLDHLAVEHRKTGAAIRAIAALESLDPSPWLDGATVSAGTVTKIRVRPALPAARKAKRQKVEGRTSKGEGQTPRPSEALPEVAIREALTSGHRTPRALVAELNLPKMTVTRMLKRLLLAGVVRKSGQRRSVRYQLST